MSQSFNSSPFPSTPFFEFILATSRVPRTRALSWRRLCWATLPLLRKITKDWVAGNRATAEVSTFWHSAFLSLDWSGWCCDTSSYLNAARSPFVLLAFSLWLWLSFLFHLFLFDYSGAAFRSFTAARSAFMVRRTRDSCALILVSFLTSLSPSFTGR